MPTLIHSTTKLELAKMRIISDPREPEGIIHGPPPPLKELKSEVASVLETYSSSVICSQTFSLLGLENTTRQKYYTLENLDTHLSSGYGQQGADGYLVVTAWVYWILHGIAVDLRVCKHTRKAVRMNEAMDCVYHKWRRWQANANIRGFTTIFPKVGFGFIETRRGYEVDVRDLY